MVAFVLGCLKLEEANKNTWYYRRFIAKETVDNIDKETSKTKLISPNNELEEEQVQEPIIVKESMLQKFKNKFNNFKSHEMLSSPIPLLTCFLYLMLGSKQILFDECLPLFSVTPKELGGLGLSSYHLGLTGGFLGFIIFMNQAFITPRVIAKFSPLICYRVSLVVDIAFNVIFPEVIWLMVSEHDPIWRHVLFWFVFVFILLLRQVSNGYSFLGTLLITNNSVTRKNSGKLNGTSQSLVSLSRMISPIVGGAIFASSTAVSKFPIDHRTVFYVVGIISVIMFFLSLILKKSINKPKEEVKVNEVAKK
ncbi:predicted protein [Naegleria gruberi]|uniref:Predicted protein n=1 Tax=Naegleria gruberi TaxID=5762 RepID=D2W1A1_NAEGR|nr:uncharacterized protein NAEGRDRAFT_75144 [Naegleria gruberi]EFC37147.1 predicted protein [Naegleria gruberi]|eukprot:XP_002669891.1 predicted protein [Naegleria gruberi strain NEG-M]